MIIRACKNCKGDGFYRMMRGEMHPLTNVAGAKLIRKKVEPTGDALYDYARSVIGYEFTCYRCKGMGEINWTRGRSLMPACTAA